MNAGSEGDRDKLNGSWAQQGETENGSTLNADGDNMHVTQTDGGRRSLTLNAIREVPVATSRSSGKKAMVSMRFNGSKLMQMETSGSEVIERSFTILAQGDVMEVEINPIVPGGKKETFQYRRTTLSAQGK